MAGPLTTLDVSSRSWWIDTGIDVKPGDTLRFEAGGTWWDASHEAGPDGISIPRVDRLRFLRRDRDALWATLIGVVGRFGERHRIGSGATVTFASAGRLRLFFNDAFGFYWNNRGAVTVAIHRG